MGKLVVATRNKGKLREIRSILADLSGLEVLSIMDFPEGTIPEVEEKGETFEENAYLKAFAVARVTGLPALADDSGLEVDALGGKPGVKSARFGGEGISDAERNEKLLALLKGVKHPHRTARFRCSMVLVVPPDFERYVTHGVCEGVIAYEPAGRYGFGYDPIFYLPEFGKTMAQLTPEQKNSISHRRRALEKMKEIIKRVLLDG